MNPRRIPIMTSDNRHDENYVIKNIHPERGTIRKTTLQICQ